MQHRDRDELEAGLATVREAPAAAGELRLICRRPAEEERELLDRGELDTERGLVGDDWERRADRRSADGSPLLDAQVTIMGARAAALVSGSEELEGWAPAGDQLYVDLDLSADNLPAGTRLRIGEAVLEVTAEPHLGCGKFSSRFGVDALKLVNSDAGRELRLRGINARVAEPGEITVGDPVEKLA
ncbi:MAG TPA: MOSC domain-containing protein [Solirubrobacterales bacterium]|nr:MOSC domain-containing protein [Solirubrobacterales bacterium]